MSLISHKHLEYAKDVVSGKITTSQAVTLQCKRTLKEHERGYVFEKSYGEKIKFIFDISRAEGRLKFISQCPHPAGRWREDGEKIKLQPWQEFFITELYGWVRVDDPRIRRFTEAILFVARKNGKTTIAAPLAMHEIAWGDAGSEVYVMATKEEQSKILWGTATDMIDGMHSKLAALFRVTAKEISSMQGVFKPLPSKAKKQDGYRPSLCLFDESAAIETADSIHVMESGMINRDSPLSLHLTTAQPTRTTLFRERYEAAKNGLISGKIPVNMLPMLYELDDPAEMDNPDMWIKANPNIDVSVSRRTLGQAVEKSKTSPREKNNNLCKHFNIFSQHEAQWMDVGLWDACAGTITKDGPAYIGFDLAENRDLAAACVVWDNGGGRFSVDWKFWTPREALDRYDDDDRRMLEQAASPEGGEVLVLLNGPIVDTEIIREWTTDVYKTYNVQSIGCDPWHAKRLTNELEELGYPVLMVAQSVAKLTDPIKDVESKVISGAITHPGHAIMQWQIQNAVAVESKGIFLTKPNGQHTKKIDGVDAMVTAFACVDYCKGAFAIGDFGVGKVPEKDDLMFV